MFEKANLAALKKNHPALHSTLENFITPPETSIGYAVIASKSGALTLTAETDGFTTLFHSGYDPVKEADRIVSSWGDMSGYRTVLFSGFGLGYVPLRALSSLNTTQRVIVVEPEMEVLSLAIKNIDLTPLFTRANTHIITGPEFMERSDDLIEGNTDKTFSFLLPPACKLDPRLISITEKGSAPLLKKRLSYPKFGSPRCKALLFESGFFLEQELMATWESRNSPFTTIEVPVSGAGETGFIKDLLSRLADFRPDYIITINRIGFDLDGKLARLLTSYKTPFVSWFVDNPLSIVERGGVASDYDISLVWDEFYVAPMKRLGFTNVHYFPYAADTTIFHASESPIKKKYPISFVASSMEKILADRLAEIRNRTGLMKIFRKLTTKPYEWGRVDIPGMVKAELSGHVVSPSESASLETATGSAITQRKRVDALLAIKDMQPHIFGDSGWAKLLPKDFTIHPPADYRRDLPAIYRATSVNLNISNLQLLNSPNQRLFDVSASSSFLLTDNPDNAAKFLAPDTQVGVFNNPRELAEKACYYLEKGNEREEMAVKACNTICSGHTYRHRTEELETLLGSIFR